MLNHLISEEIKKYLNEDDVKMDKYGNPIPRGGQGYGPDPSNPLFKNRQGYEADGSKGPWFSRSVAVATAVLLNDNASGEWYVLANQRGSGTPDYRGYWNLPCGYLDYNEDANEAAVREVREETGIRLNPSQLKSFGYSASPYENRQNVCIFFGTVINGSLQDYPFSTAEMEDNEVSGIKWIPLAEVDNFQWAFDHDQLLQKALAQIGPQGKDEKGYIEQAIQMLQQGANPNEVIRVLQNAL